MFWIATIVMALLAFGFIATPLLRTNRRMGPVGIAIALPVFAASLYWVVGSPEAAAVAAYAPAVNQRTLPSSTAKSAGSVASMVDGLADRLKNNPADGKGWLLLARSYKHLQRWPEAHDAYENAAALGEYDEELARLSDSTVAIHPVAAQVVGTVRLSQESKQIVAPTDTVFVFARAVGGPPMPLAVVQQPAAALPLDFVLSDRQSMSAAARLSNYEQVVVTARISRSGVADDALPGLEAKSDLVLVTDNRPLELVIRPTQP